MLPNSVYLKGFADIIIEDVILIKSLRIIQGSKGLFVSMPQEQAKDHKWYDRIKCLNEDIKEQITNVVLDAYEQETATV